MDKYNVYEGILKIKRILREYWLFDIQGYCRYYEKCPHYRFDNIYCNKRKGLLKEYNLNKNCSGWISDDDFIDDFLEMKRTKYRCKNEC
jgi:hypothetical protein